MNEVHSEPLAGFQGHGLGADLERSIHPDAARHRIQRLIEGGPESQIIVGCPTIWHSRDDKANTAMFRPFGEHGEEVQMKILNGMDVSDFSPSTYALRVQWTAVTDHHTILDIPGRSTA